MTYSTLLMFGPKQRKIVRINQCMLCLSGNDRGMNSEGVFHVDALDLFKD